MWEEVTGVCIDFPSFYDFDILFWNCSDSVVFFIFHFIPTLQFTLYFHSTCLEIAKSNAFPFCFVTVRCPLIKKQLKDGFMLRKKQCMENAISIRCVFAKQDNMFGYQKSLKTTKG